MHYDDAHLVNQSIHGRASGDVHCERSVRPVWRSSTSTQEPQYYSLAYRHGDVQGQRGSYGHGLALKSRDFHHVIAYKRFAQHHRRVWRRRELFRKPIGNFAATGERSRRGARSGHVTVDRWWHWGTGDVVVLPVGGAPEEEGLEFQSFKSKGKNDALRFAGSIGFWR